MGMGGMGGGTGGVDVEDPPISGLLISGHGVILGTANVSDAIKATEDVLREKAAAEKAREEKDKKKTPKTETDKTTKDVKGKDAAADPDGGEKAAENDATGTAAGEDADASKATTGAAAAPDAEGVTPETSPEERKRLAAERAKKQATPELAFIELLKASDFVDPDEEYTGIKTYIPPQSIDNLSSFVIQLKFKEQFDSSNLSQ